MSKLLCNLISQLRIMFTPSGSWRTFTVPQDEQHLIFASHVRATAKTRPDPGRDRDRDRDRDPDPVPVADAVRSHRLGQLIMRLI